MTYQDLNPLFFLTLQTEDDARRWLWRAKNDGRDFVCPECRHDEFYPLRFRPEVRKCRRCRRHVRLRPGTILERSKLPVLTWLRAMVLMMQDKRGVSALQTQRQLGMKSYGTTWSILHKIRHALVQREANYKLQGLIELDGADFRRQARRDVLPADVLVAIETKKWVDDKGRAKSRAGFAKIMLANESRFNSQTFINKAVEKGASVNADGNPAFRNLRHVAVDTRVTRGDKLILDRWLPWVHKLISNAKTWLMGTHHGIGAKYLNNYLSEYLYRFNRRHDPNRLSHRALRACALASPITYGALFG
jgi:transposase-like protein